VNVNTLAVTRRRRSAPPSPAAAWRELHRAACAPYRGAGRFAWHFARGKLAYDPVFRDLLVNGWLPPGARVVDLGCGQGLLASLLAAAEAAAHAGRWPAAWPSAPAGASYDGIELMAADTARARAAFRQADAIHPARVPRFVCADMLEEPLPTCDVAVLFDVLHYVEPAAQQAMLERVRAALVPGGRLLLRIADAACRKRYAWGLFVDRVAARLRGHRAAPVFGHPLAQWEALLQRLGFRVTSVPMSRGTLFANVMLIADLPRELAPRPSACQAAT
jgi:SAM-dependent methyltransferase